MKLLLIDIEKNEIYDNEGFIMIKIEKLPKLDTLAFNHLENNL